MGNTDRSGYLLHKNENADIKDVHNIVHDIQKSGTDGVWMENYHEEITSTTFIDINGLKYPVEPHSRYFIDWVLFVETITYGLYACVNAPDEFNYMALSIFNWNGKAQKQDVNDFVEDILLDSISGTFPLRISGYIETGDSGGYLQGRIAAANAANRITVHIGSGGIVKKIS